MPRARRLDARLLELAARYGGVLTKALVVSELGLSLEEAGALLDRFCRHGEAREVPRGQITLYIFPSAQAGLSRAELKVLNALIDDPGGMTREELLSHTGLPPDELDDALLSLSLRKAVRFLSASGEYKLSCLSPPRKRKHRRRSPRGRTRGRGAPLARSY